MRPRDDWRFAKGSSKASLGGGKFQVRSLVLKVRLVIIEGDESFYWPEHFAIATVNVVVLTIGADLGAGPHVPTRPPHRARSSDTCWQEVGSNEKASLDSSGPYPHVQRVGGDLGGGVKDVLTQGSGG